MNEELLIVGLLLNAIFAVFAIWVFFDARTRKNRSFGWSLLTFILGPFVVLPLYFAYRNLKTGEVRVGGNVWHIFRNYTLAWTVLVLLIVPVIIVLDPVEGLMFSFLIGVIWFIVTVAIMLVGLFFKQSNVIERGPSKLE